MAATQLLMSKGAVQLGRTLIRTALYGCLLACLLILARLQPLTAGEHWPGEDSAPETLQGSVTDVAVTSIMQVGPPFATQGSIVTLQIGVANNGSAEATFHLTLLDDTENKELDSTSVTLATAAITSVQLQWDTTGASGGPPPPGPPTPGTIHALTASANLEGDTDPSNNSSSLLPGIWIIAAPSSPEITFPDPFQEPQARYGEDLASESPSVDTSAESLSNIFASESGGEKYQSVAAVNISTNPVHLAGIFHGLVDGGKNEYMSDPGMSILPETLTSIFGGGSLSRWDSGLMKPAVETTFEKPVEISVEEVPAKNRWGLRLPDIVTLPEPLERVIFDRSTASLTRALSLPGYGTPADPLTSIFSSSSDANVPGLLKKANLPRHDILTLPIDVQGTQAFLDSSFSLPIVGTRPAPLTRIFSSSSDANVPGLLKRVNLPRRHIPTLTIEASGSQAFLDSSFSLPIVGTRPAPLSTIYNSPTLAESTGNLSTFSPSAKYKVIPEPLLPPDEIPGEVTPKLELPTPDIANLRHPYVERPVTTHSPARPLARPFNEAIVRGKLRLQGRDSNMGSYVVIGDKVTFADRNGSFKTEAPQGRFDIKLMAPGYLTVTIPDNSLEPGQSLTLPQITLTFGDANGDGVVDIYDLALAAGNFGATATQSLLN